MVLSEALSACLFCDPFIISSFFRVLKRLFYFFQFVNPDRCFSAQREMHDKNSRTANIVLPPKRKPLRPDIFFVSYFANKTHDFGLLGLDYAFEPLLSGFFLAFLDQRNVSGRPIDYIHEAKLVNLIELGSVHTP